MADGIDLKKDIENKKVLVALQDLLTRATDRTTQSIFRENRAHQKSSAILSAIKKATDNIEKRVTNTKRAVEKSQAAHQRELDKLELKIQAQKELVKAQDELVKKQALEGKATSIVVKAEQKLFNLEKKKAVLENRHLVANKAFKKFLVIKDKEIKKELKARRSLSDIEGKYEESDIYFIRNEKEYNVALEHRLRLQEESLEVLYKTGRINETEYKKRQKGIRGEEGVAETRKGLRGKALGSEVKREQYREYLKEFLPSYKEEPGGKFRGRGGKFVKAEEGIRAKGESLKFAKQERYELTKELGGKFRALKSARGIGGHLEAAKGIGETIGKLKDLSATLGGVGKGAKGAAGMFGTLGTAMGMLGKIGWIGLIISAVTMIIKTVNELNKFVKEYNKSFVKMYGPTVAMKDVSKSMKTFTDAVFDMNRNLKYGLKSEDIMGLFDAMSAGGLSLQGVGKRVEGGYNEVILEATKLSKDFGVDMSAMGGMIADQMVNLKSSLDDVSKSMEAMAYDATIAGISSQKFYDAVTAATDSLAYYGNYLKSTSALLRTFAERGAMPFKDAAKEAQDIMNVFKGMDTTKKMGFIQIVGEKKVREDMSLRAEQLKKEEDVLDDQIATAKRVGELERAHALEQEKNDKKRARINIEAYAKGDIQALATGLDYMTDKTADYLITALKKVGVDDIFDTDNLLAKSEILAQSAGVPKEALTKLLETGRVVLDDAKKSAEFIGDKFEKIPKESSDKLKEVMSGFMLSIKKGDVIDEDQMRSTLKDFVSNGGELGMDIEDFIDQFKKNAFALDAAVSGVHLNAEDMRKYAEELFRTGVSFKSGAADQGKRIDELVKNTATFEDFIGIGKENMKYMAAMAGGGKLQDMANEAAMVTAQRVGGIFGLLQKWATGKPESFVTDEEYMKKGGDYDKLVAASKAQTLLQKKLYDLQEKYEKTVSPAEKKILGEQIDQTKEQIKEQENTKNVLSKDRFDLASGAVLKGAQEAQGDIETKTKLEDRKSELEAKLKGGKLSEAESGSARAEIAETNRKLDDLNKAIDTIPVASEKVKGPIKSAPVAEGDFEALTGGMTNVSKGDMVIDSDSLAKGLSGSKGQFASKLIPDTGSAVGSNVVVHMTFGDLHEIHDVDGFLKEVGPAMKQLVAREIFETKKRK